MEWSEQVDESSFTRKTEYWHQLPDGRVQCDVCPRACKLHEGQRGLCFVRGREDNQILLYSYGKSSGFCVDPIEKKPLNHFLPGTPVLSFGTAGCNLACKFCQNWDMSKSRQMDVLSSKAMPRQLADTAKRLQCRSIAFTYNDPVIFLEYAIDTAVACHEMGLKSVAVSAGYIEEKPREVFFRHMDAANIDLKSFNQDFYWKICGGHLQHVLDTLLYLKHETAVWFEITTLLISGENDSDTELHALSEWVYSHLGPDTPIHFTAFHPDWKMRDIHRTPAVTLMRARKIAMQTGLRFVYTGNVHDSVGGSTYCPSCDKLLIERDWYSLGEWNVLVDQYSFQAHCSHCHARIAGIFENAPGSWGAKRQVIRIIPD
ncbi:hypothetical protein TDB9533_00391 [Thalassocella blandensis]|nr:hypothetical protein TDB9533_00391 [Thalassocella blandensis]